MFQQITIAGNLGSDPEMRYTTSGQAVTNFSVAANRQYTGKDGQRVKETVWFRVSAWGRQAETCNQYLGRGDKVLIIGRMTADPATGGPRMWSGSDGQMRASYEVTAQNVTFIELKGERVSNADSGFDNDDDEIPF